MTPGSSSSRPRQLETEIDDTKQRIATIVADIAHLLRIRPDDVVPATRLWCYVDSQETLFGECSTIPLSAEFRNHVCFLKATVKAHDLLSPLIQQQGNTRDGQNPRLAFPASLPLKSNPKNFIEIPLFSQRPQTLLKELPSAQREPTADDTTDTPTVTPADLLGVLCIDAPYDGLLALLEEHREWARQKQHYEWIDHPRDREAFTRIGDPSEPDHSRFEQLLAAIRRLRHRLIFLSAVRTQVGFHAAQQDASRTTLWAEHPTIPPRPESLLSSPLRESVLLSSPLGNLRKLLARTWGQELDVSVFIRRVVDPTNRLALLAGDGQFYDQLRAIRVHPRFGKFAEYVVDVFHRDSSVKHLLFPGSGSIATHQECEKAISQSASWFPEGSELSAALNSIRQSGSIGAFAVRARITAERPSDSVLVAVLYVTVTNKRNFFKWGRRLLLETFSGDLVRTFESSVQPVLGRVSPNARRQLLATPRILSRMLPASVTGPLIPGRRRTNSATTCRAYIISVDIRGSTELMQLAQEAKGLYGEFLLGLSQRMRGIIHAECGVFDKFTGDGILAFFPDFFSGPRRDAGVRVLRAAVRCHELFAAVYPELAVYLSRAPSLEESGLGIGIDLGEVQLATVGDELTVVGLPVVNACRLSSATKSQRTLVTLRAVKRMQQDGISGPFCSYSRAPAETKHAGTKSETYEVTLNLDRDIYGDVASSTWNLQEWKGWQASWDEGVESPLKKWLEGHARPALESSAPAVPQPVPPDTGHDGRSSE